MFPNEWEGADFSDEATRKAFADFLEEKGDWRAEEVRRIWWKLSDRKTYYIVYSGVWFVSSYSNEKQLKNGINRKMFAIFHDKQKISPKDWQ